MVGSGGHAQLAPRLVLDPQAWLLSNNPEEIAVLDNGICIRMISAYIRRGRTMIARSGNEREFNRGCKTCATVRERRVVGSEPRHQVAASLQMNSRVNSRRQRDCSISVIVESDQDRRVAPHKRNTGVSR